jgi:protein-S-isoprenylcysteine O-methyltransferase Ste14
MPVILKAASLTVITLVIVYFSRASLGRFRLHGFYRFFAWEMIAVLIVLNVDFWFRTPLAWNQLLSWTLLCASLFLVFQSFALLHKAGRPDAARKDEGLIGVEKTTELVTSGAYRFIRHPMYASLLYLAWGVFFKRPSWPGVALAAGASGFLVLTAKVEEKENLRFFGRAYSGLMSRTKMFVPFLF